MDGSFHPVLADLDGREAPLPTSSPPPLPGGFLAIFPRVALPMFLALADQSIVATALTAIAAELGSVARISLLVVGYLIAATVAAPVYGSLGDRFGRRRLLLGALVVFMCASVLCFFSTSLPMLVAARALQGLGGGGLMALSQALIGERVPPRERARYQGYLAGLGVTSNAFGPVMGGLLTEYVGWRAIFVVNLPLGLAAFWLIYRLPRRGGSRGDAFVFDWSGLLLYASFVISVLLVLDDVQKASAAEPSRMAMLGGVAVLSLMFLIPLELRKAEPLLPVDLFRDPTIWRANTIAGCFGGILVSLLTFVPIYMRIVHGASPAELGLLLIPMTVCIGVGSLITGQIVSRTGHTAMLPSCGLPVVVLGLIALALWADRMQPGELSAALGGLALFLGTTMSVVQVSVQSAAGQARLGAAAAAVQYSRSMGAALGTAIVGAVLFGSLAHSDPEVSRVFESLLQGEIGSGAAVSQEVVRAAFASAFSFGFLSVAGLAAIAMLLFWTMPLRRI